MPETTNYRHVLLVLAGAFLGCDRPSDALAPHSDECTKDCVTMVGSKFEDLELRQAKVEQRLTALETRQREFEERVAEILKRIVDRMNADESS